MLIIVMIWIIVLIYNFIYNNFKPELGKVAAWRGHRRGAGELVHSAASSCSRLAGAPQHPTIEYHTGQPSQPAGGDPFSM